MEIKYPIVEGNPTCRYMSLHVGACRRMSLHVAGQYWDTPPTDGQKRLSMSHVAKKLEAK
jgi:hypothetical protein